MIINTIHLCAAGDPSVGIPDSHATITDVHIDLDTWAEEDQPEVLAELRSKIVEAFSIVWDPEPAVVFDFEAEALDAEMEPEPFKITARRHPAGDGFRVFPHGIWYGYVDGYSCTSPQHLEGSAKAAARGALKSGSLAALLRDQRTTFQAWLANPNTSPKNVAAAERGLAEIASLLNKLSAAFPDEDWAGD